MDYRHTEAFARQMEAAALRAHDLRREAIAEFGIGIARSVRGAVRWLVLRGRRAPQSKTPAL
jgi:hypothetical protein